MTQSKWQVSPTNQGYFVGLDIVGFSKLDPVDGLLEARSDLFDAVRDSLNFNRALSQGAVAVQFLGDELRLAFHVEVGARLVRDFIDDVLYDLKAMGHTQIRGVVLSGFITCDRWPNDRNQGCWFLAGVLPFQYESLQRLIQPQQVVINGEFRNSLRMAEVPVHTLRSFQLGGADAYILRDESRPWITGPGITLWLASPFGPPVESMKIYRTRQGGFAGHSAGLLKQCGGPCQKISRYLPLLPVFWS